MIPFEHKGEPLLPLQHFYQRLFRGALLAGAVVAGSLAIGVAGYHWIARLAWVDALLDASMILAGMGPVSPLGSAGAKIFASAYALFSGVAFLTSVGLLLAPAVHRFLHHFHLQAEDDGE